MTNPELDAAVIGAGVSGLTTAICLAEAGLAVGVYADQPPQRTTSAAAGALWGPYLVGQDERIMAWADLTLASLLGMLDNPATGVRLIHGTVASQTPQPDPPDWIACLDGHRPRAAENLPAGYPAGWRFAAPVICMPVYLSYLLARLRRAGADVRDDCVFGSLPEAADRTGARTVVNCSGTGARSLVPDPAVVPVRGQVVVVANPGIDEFFVGTSDDSDDISYVFPHRDTVVLGGTEDLGNWSLEPDPAIAARIIRACTAIEPRLAGAEIIAHRVGLRPTRLSVRLEAEELDHGRRLLHNYGHGGAGVTLSWGCALDVAKAILG